MSLVHDHDLPTLIAARTEAIESMYPDDSAMGQELAEICGSHVDYICNNDRGQLQTRRRE